MLGARVTPQQVELLRLADAILARNGLTPYGRKKERRPKVEQTPSGPRPRLIFTPMGGANRWRR